MTDPLSRTYYRPIPQPRHLARHPLAGGWCGFTQVEALQRGRPVRIVDTVPDDWLARLTAPRSDIAGLAMNRPRLMGIVNATPDSFSDGGLYDPAMQGRSLIDAGADLLDIGGESTRPGAVEIAPDVETARILPAISALSGQVAISVDTRKSHVARLALDAGAVLVNDVSGLDFDPDMAPLLAARGIPVCLMHAQGLPSTMQDDPRYDDVVLDVYDALAQRLERAEAAGVARRDIVIDPGIGFGKTMAHNLAILRRISLYHGLGCPILLGLSRKGFIGTLGRAPKAQDRVSGTLALTLAAVDQGVQIHRVHDVEQIAQGLSLWQALSNDENEKAGR